MPLRRPQIICHMVTSLDGRLLAERWTDDLDALVATYDAVADRLDADGWIVGRETMAHYLAEGAPNIGPAPLERPDRIADRGGRGLAVCFDRQGRLRPESAVVEGEHLVLVLSQRVSDGHVEALAGRGVSVVFSGPKGEDIAGALARIGAGFGVKRLLLEGGGALNGAFLAAGLIDETSTLIHPVVDGQQGVPAIYDHPQATPRALELIASEVLEGGTVWLRHRIEEPETARSQRPAPTP